jgi:hypothetical protein
LYIHVTLLFKTSKALRLLSLPDPVQYRAVQ